MIRFLTCLLLFVTCLTAQVRMSVTLTSPLNMQISDNFSLAPQTYTELPGTVMIDHVLSPSSIQKTESITLTSGVVGSAPPIESSFCEADFRTYYSADSYKLTVGFSGYDFAYGNAIHMTHSMAFNVTIGATTTTLDGILRITMSSWENTEPSLPYVIHITDSTSGDLLDYKEFTHHPIPVMPGNVLITPQERYKDRSVYLTPGQSTNLAFSIGTYSTLKPAPGLMFSLFPMSNAKVVVEYIPCPNSAGSVHGLVETVTDHEANGGLLIVGNETSPYSALSPIRYQYAMYQNINSPVTSIPLVVVGYPLVSPVTLSSGCSVYCDGIVGMFNPLYSIHIFHTFLAPIYPGIDYYVQGIFVDTNDINNSTTTQMIHVL